MQNKKGKLFVVLGPSGVGKGTVLSGFLKQNKNVVYSVSTTTRAPRTGEISGVHYNFETKENFLKLISEGDFLEYAEYSGNYYGTSASFVNSKLEKGFDVVLEIEVQGAKKVLEKMPEAITVFILPPTVEELEKRLRGRNTEAEDVIEKRLKRAIEELKEAKNCKYNIINDEVENAISKLQKIYEDETNAEK